MIYTIQARASYPINGWRRNVQLPTFYLDADVQGIVSAQHAETIAREMIQSVNPDAEAFVSVGVRE